MKLTEDAIAALTVEPGRKDRLVFDSTVPGLGVRITETGRRMFIVQWTDAATGVKRREPLGAWGAITLKAAQSAARVKLGQVASGIDPRVERLRRKAAHASEKAESSLSLERLISDWATIHLAARRPRYSAEAQRALRSAFADDLAKPASRLTKERVVTRLDAMIAAGKTTTAARVLSYGRACYGWARKRGRVAANPFQDVPIATKATERERTLREGETREVWAAAGSLPSPVGAFYRLALLTLARRDEVAGMRWSEIDGDRWIIPGARTKNGKAHTVHLSAEARAVLASLPRFEECDAVFTTNGTSPISGFSKFKVALDRAINAAREADGREPIEPFVLHDFRRTGVSTLASWGFDSIVADKLLNHQPSKLRGVASVYQRHEFLEERARALIAWGAFCAGAVLESNVMRLAPRAA